MAELLKNIFFTSESIDDLSNAIQRVHPAFDVINFKKCILAGEWEMLELKQKMRHVSTCLYKYLPEDYIQALEILERIAPEIKGFEAMTLPDYVEQYGQDHFDRSLQALAWFTRYSSAEFAIRPFMIRDQNKVIDFMFQLAGSDHEWVRRFSSEGCRPRLPWAMSLPGLQKDPSPILPILEKLVDDPSETVRRSVANNLNDISKDHPAWVINLCRKWKGKSIETDRLIKHGLRTLLKEGRTEALRLFDYADPDQIKDVQLKLARKNIPIGSETFFGISVKNVDSGPVKLRLEYAIYYRKSNAGLSKKVYQVAEKEFGPGMHQLKRKLTFKDMTTRKHYTGEHILSFIINGKEIARSSFHLIST